MLGRPAAHNGDAKDKRSLASCKSLAVKQEANWQILCIIRTPVAASLHKSCQSWTHCCAGRAAAAAAAVESTAHVLIELDEITGLGCDMLPLPAAQGSGAILQQLTVARHTLLLVRKTIVVRFLGKDNAALGLRPNGGLGH